MKEKIKKIIEKVCKQKFDKDLSVFDNFVVDTPKQDAHGDFSTNAAMVLASSLKRKPYQIAEDIKDSVFDESVEKIEIAGPGFINFFIKKESWHFVLDELYKKGDRFGSSNMGKNKKILLEFVSANPTGPLHVGHGRGATLGDVLAKLLRFASYDVKTEYYVNNAGLQIQTLGKSVFYRYLELQGEKIDFPETCYQGDYIRQIAKQIDENCSDIKNKNTDEQLLICAEYAYKKILDDIKKTLSDFGIKMDSYFDESTIHENNKVDLAIEALKKKDLIYEKDNAIWFKSSNFKDEKDRVLIRSNHEKTYFAADIAYHKDKFDRGFDKLINIWGADHHGYVPRMKAFVEALGRDPEDLHLILVQLVSLIKDKEVLSMSTRKGKFITLDNLIDEVGKDAARFIFLTRSHESHLDFDIDVAKEQTSNNPVYYVQYAHARIFSVFEKGQIKIEDIKWQAAFAEFLKEDLEIAILKKIAKYPEIIQLSAQNIEVHRICFYLMELASLFHNYYNKYKILVEDEQVKNARIAFIFAIQKLIKNGLDLLGINAPLKM